MAEKKLIIQSKKYRGDTAVVSARLPSDLIKRIDEVAERTGRTRNEIVQLCLEFSIDSIVVNND